MVTETGLRERIRSRVVREARPLTVSEYWMSWKPLNGFGKVSARGRDYFYDDEMAQVWVIYHLQIIGEAVRGLSSEFRTATPDIIGMRNILIHHYSGIDRDAVWNVIEDNLPALKRQLSCRAQEQRLTDCGAADTTISRCRKDTHLNTFLYPRDMWISSVYASQA